MLPSPQSYVPQYLKLAAVLGWSACLPAYDGRPADENTDTLHWSVAVTEANHCFFQWATFSAYSVLGILEASGQFSFVANKPRYVACDWFHSLIMNYPHLSTSLSFHGSQNVLWSETMRTRQPGSLGDTAGLIPTVVLREFLERESPGCSLEGGGGVQQHSSLLYLPDNVICRFRPRPFLILHSKANIQY